MPKLVRRHVLSSDLQAIFDRNEDSFRRRVSTLEQAVSAILAGHLDEDLRAAAERDAHTLAGSLGSFGLDRGSELAAELEQRLAPTPSPSPRSPAIDDGRLVRCVSSLREQLDGVSEHAGDDLPAGEPRPPPGRAGAEIGLGTSEPAVTKAGRILVVDDDDAIRDVLVGILEDDGYDVCAVAGASEARHALEHDTIALLLSDVRMPGETGLDLIRFALSEHPGTATLLISALEDPGIAQVAMEFGAYGYLSKPVRRTPVLIGVMNALRRRDMEQRERAAREHLESTVSERTSALSQALARLEAAALHNRELQAETIYRWARAVEHRDPGIGRHLKRMSRYCAVIGSKLGLHAESLELASVLHDVGQTEIPDSILLKLAPLTADEQLAFEAHTDIGYGMLSGSSSRVLDLAALIARTHHEKFDGSGYPRGLCGAAIALEGRIAAVADVFDTLTRDRDYRPAWSAQSAVEWMTAERGRHFDPSVLDAFLFSIEQILAIRAELTLGQPGPECLDPH